MIHIPLHISRPNLSLPSTCRPLPHCSTRTDNNEDAFYTEGIKKKKTRDTQPSRGSSSSKQRDTSNIPEAAVLFHPRHDCSSSTTVSFFFFLSFSFPFSSSLSFSFFFSPQHPRSLWGTHYRCSFHVISESQLSPFRATLQARRLSICGRAWIFFFPFYSPFYFFFSSPLYFTFRNMSKPVWNFNKANLNKILDKRAQ